MIDIKKYGKGCLFQIPITKDWVYIQHPPYYREKLPFNFAELNFVELFKLKVNIPGVRKTFYMTPKAIFTYQDQFPYGKEFWEIGKDIQWGNEVSEPWEEDQTNLEYAIRDINRQRGSDYILNLPIMTNSLLYYKLQEKYRRKPYDL